MDSEELENRFLRLGHRTRNIFSVVPPQQRSERAIQTIKSMMTKSTEKGKHLAVVLLNCRFTPTLGEQFPAVLLMGRKLPTFLPTLPCTLNASYLTEMDQELLKKKQKQHRHLDCPTRTLSPLVPVNPNSFAPTKGGKRQLSFKLVQRLADTPSKLTPEESSSETAFTFDR